MRVLELDAGHADAYFLLAMIAASAANFAKACELIERALQLGATRAEYLIQLARCLAMLNRDGAARAAAERALQSDIEDALSLDTLGVVLSRLGDHERAVELFERAVAAQPNSASFQYNLAASLRFLGRFEAAASAYEAAIDADPELYRAHSALAELGTQTREHNHIERLEALLAQVGEDIDGHLHLCHALAKEYEDLGERATAFRYLERGKRKKRASLGYSIAADESLFRAVQQAFPVAAAAGESSGYANDEPIFVIGMPRSGTTLIERVLSSHAEVSSAGELQNFGICLKRAAQTESSQVLDEATLRRGLDLDMAALGRAYIDSTRPVTGRCRHFVDKMPLNFFYVGFIHRALPNAKIVCLRRHPLDTCLSNYRQLFAVNFSYYNYAYDLADIGSYYAMFDALMAHWARALPGKVLELSYERFVHDQEGQTRRLLEHCGLAWDAGCLEFQHNSAPVATASAVQVRRGLNADSIGRWRRYAAQLEPLRRQLEAAGIDLG